MKQVQHGHINFSKRTRVKDEGDEQVREISKQLKQITRGNPGQMLALALSR